jgi:hypothetical protein
MHASRSAYPVTEFYDSQFDHEAEALRNSKALLERMAALEQIPSILVYLTQRKNKHDLSGMPNRCSCNSVMLIDNVTPLNHFYGTRLYLWNY